MNEAMGSSVRIDVRGVLFDMDGVLVSSTGSVLRCWRQWAAHYGVPNADRIEIPHGMRAIEIIDHFVPGVDKIQALRLIEDIEIADVADLKVLPGVRALLGSLPGDRWAIVTSATRRLLVARLAAAGLPIPDRLISADMVTRGKPDPEPYLRGAATVGVPAAECLVLEDAPSGVRAGVQAGCRVLGVEGTHTGDELLAVGAHFVVRSLEQVSAAEVNGMLQITVTAGQDGRRSL